MPNRYERAFTQQEAKVFTFTEEPSAMMIKSIEHRLDAGSLLMLDFGPMYGLTVNATRPNYDQDTGRVTTVPNKEAINQLISGKLVTDKESQARQYRTEVANYNKRVSHILTLDQVQNISQEEDFFDHLSPQLLYGSMWRLPLKAEYQDRPEYDIQAHLASETGIQLVMFAPENPLSQLSKNLHLVGSSANPRGTETITEFFQAKEFADQLNQIGKPCVMVDLAEKEKHRLRHGSYPILRVLPGQKHKTVELVRACDQFEIIAKELNKNNIQIIDK